MCVNKKDCKFALARIFFLFFYFYIIEKYVKYHKLLKEKL